MGIPNLDLFQYLADEFRIFTFVETGSGHGETAVKATKIFPQVHTIELSNSLYQEVNKKIGSIAKVYHGRSDDILKIVLPTIDAPILFWLDAHWSQGPTAGEHYQSPLMGELEEINRRPGNNDFIFIDDAHLFFSPAVLKPPYDIRQWPSIMQVFDQLNKKERFTIILQSFRCAKHGHPGGIVFPENVIVSVPGKAKDRLISWCRLFKLEGVND